MKKRNPGTRWCIPHWAAGRNGRGVGGVGGQQCHGVQAGRPGGHGRASTGGLLARLSAAAHPWALLRC